MLSSGQDVEISLLTAACISSLSWAVQGQWEGKGGVGGGGGCDCRPAAVSSPGMDYKISAAL